MTALCLQLRIGALTAEHDMGLKLKQARSFLEKGFRVKLVVRFGHWQRANGEARLRSTVEECKQWAHVTAPQVRNKQSEAWRTGLQQAASIFLHVVLKVSTLGHAGLICSVDALAVLLQRRPTRRWPATPS